MPKCDFGKVIEIALRHGCSPVNLLHIFRAPSPPKNTSRRLLLKKAVKELSFHICRIEAFNFSRNELFHS